MMKKALREMQTLRAGCSKAEPKIFALPQTPFPGRSRAGRPKFSLLEMVTTFTNKLSFVRIDARKFRVIVVTDPPTHTHTHQQSGPITIYRAAASAQCNQSQLLTLAPSALRMSQRTLPNDK